MQSNTELDMETRTKVNEDAKAAAQASWYRLYKEGKIREAAAAFTEQARISSSYIGNQLNFQKVQEAAESHLHNYVRFEAYLESGIGEQVEVESDLNTTTFALCTRLGLPAQWGGFRAKWYKAWPRYQIALRRNSLSHKHYLDEVLQGLIGEHTSIGLDADDAKKLAHKQLQIGIEGYAQQNWAKVEELELEYFKELFATLSRK